MNDNDRLLLYMFALGGIVFVLFALVWIATALVTTILSFAIVFGCIVLGAKIGAGLALTESAVGSRYQRFERDKEDHIYNVTLGDPFDALTPEKQEMVTLIKNYFEGKQRKLYQDKEGSIFNIIKGLFKK